MAWMAGRERVLDLHAHGGHGLQERQQERVGAPICLVAYGKTAAMRLIDADLPGSYCPGWLIAEYGRRCGT